MIKKSSILKGLKGVKSDTCAFLLLGQHLPFTYGGVHNEGSGRKERAVFGI